MPRASNAQPRRLLQQPPPIIRRYVQRWVHRKLWPTLEAFVRAYMRWKLPRTEKLRKRELEKTFESVKYYALQSEKWDLPAASVLFNIGLHLLLAERDIQAVKIDALTHPDEWTRKLHARIILLTIYEWDTDKVTGQELRKALDTIQAPDDLKKETFEALRMLRRVREKVGNQFGDLRNKTIAHRDPDALLVYRAIRDLRTKDVTDAAIDFYAGVDAFMKVLTKLMLQSSSLESMLRQWQGKTAPLPIKSA